MLNFRSELIDIEAEKEAEKILRQLPFLFNENTIDELLKSKKILFIASQKIIYIKEWQNGSKDKKRMYKMDFDSSEFTILVLSYIEDKLKKEEYEVFRTRRKVYLSKKINSKRHN